MGGYSETGKIIGKTAGNKLTKYPKQIRKPIILEDNSQRDIYRIQIKLMGSLDGKKHFCFDEIEY